MRQINNKNIYEKLKNDIRRIAVHSGNLIVGDTVMLNPLMRSLRDSFPHAQIDYIGFIQPFVENFARRVLPFDNFIKLDLKKNWLNIAFELPSLIKKIKNLNYDLIVDNQSVVINSFILRLVRNKWLLSQSANGIFSNLPVPRDKERPKHVIDKSTAPLKLIGLPFVYNIPEINVSHDEIAKVDAFLREHKITHENPIIGIAPYSGHEIKNWSIKYYLELIRLLQKMGIKKFIIFTSFNQLSRAKVDFEPLISDVLFSVEIMPASQDIAMALPLIHRMNYFIANDSGLAHVSSALGVPTVTIFGPTSPSKFAPRGKNVSIIKPSISCSPCNIYKPCPYKNKCLMEITPDEVIKSISIH